MEPFEGDGRGVVGRGRRSGRRFDEGGGRLLVIKITGNDWFR
jgi:hypothetical protein